MKHYLFPILLFSAFLCVLPACGQQEIAINKKLQWKDICYDRHIGSIRLFKGDNDQSIPLLELGRSDETLTLLFDDLSETRGGLYYTIVHCNADWEEDNLYVADYMDGFVQNPLNQFQHSHISRSRYTHYSLTFPNRDVKLKISGNYLIKVYEKNPAEPLFVRGFSILEPRCKITARIRPVSATGEDCKQQLELSLQHPALEVRNAFVELKVRIEQNGYRIPNIMNPEPTFINPTSTEYTQADRLWYDGGNEYRIFDTRTLDFGALGVVRTRMDNDGFYYAQLETDNRRTNKRYTFNNDIDGRFHIEANRTRNSETEAEYVTTIFTLSAPSPYDNGNVYVFGELSNNTIDERFRMEYNAGNGAYELNVPLKQGYYNYRYIWINDLGKVDMSEIEGCYSETQNTYDILVYFRSPRDRYDRLVGFSSLNTLSGK